MNLQIIAGTISMFLEAGYSFEEEPSGKFKLHRPLDTEFNKAMLDKAVVFLDRLMSFSYDELVEFDVGGENYYFLFTDGTGKRPQTVKVSRKELLASCGSITLTKDPQTLQHHLVGMSMLGYVPMLKTDAKNLPHEESLEGFDDSEYVWVSKRLVDPDTGETISWHTDNRDIMLPRILPANPLFKNCSFFTSPPEVIFNDE